MATPIDYGPFIDPKDIAQAPLANYGGATGLPRTGGTYKTDPGALSNYMNSWATNPGKFIDPVGSSFLSDLFSNEETKWKPYQDAQGNWVWADPTKKNPVPLATVPGATLAPSKTYRKTAGDVQAVTDLLPYLQKAINEGTLPAALAQLKAAQVTSPAYAQLITELFNTYGPQLSAIGSEIQRREAFKQAERDRDVLRGPGGETVREAYDLAQVFDKPWYDTRADAAQRQKELFASIDLSGALSPTERDEISKGIAREGARTGTLNAPSQSNAVANAMRYGEKGYQRAETAKSNLSKALANASAFLPGAKSGVDVFQVATGKPSGVNPGTGQFPGITKPGNESAYGLAGNLLSGMNAMNITQMNIDANKKDALDKFNQIASGIGSLTSSAGSIAGMAGICWVAREVYGEDSPHWKSFRNWMLSGAPIWFFRLYIKYGEKFADMIRNKPNIKRFIRKLMDLTIQNHYKI